MCVCTVKIVSRCRSARSSSARAQIERRAGEREDELALPHPVHRHVDVVAAARRVEPAGGVLAARLDDQALDVKEQILAGAVVRAPPQIVVLRHGVERRRGSRGRPRAETMPLRGEHHQVRVVDRHQRREEQRLRVLEVLVEHVGDVLGREGHRR